MTRSDVNPVWDHLPHNPQSFFELKEDFDRKDLKRSYNRLLRRYKPERFPDEFQRIRDAYEQLDNQLRYGAQFSQSAEPHERYDWSVPDVQESTHSSNDPAAPKSRKPRQPATQPAAPSLHERLATEPVKKLYAELAAIPEKQPYHHYALAVLSDGLEPHDPQIFIKRILAGLKDCPGDPALFLLLYAYVRNSVADNQIVGVLKAVSQVVQDDRYYFVTEPLWDRLLKAGSFPKFRRLLEQCEAKVSDFQMIRRLTFYVHILKSAIWSADADWTADAFGIIEEHYQELPPFLEYDIELLFHLREYLAIRDEFLEGHPLRRFVDRTIKACCTEDALEAERAFVGCQVKLTSIGRDLLDAFPCLEHSADIDTFTALWQLVGSEYSDRFTQSEGESSQRSFRVWPMLVELEAKTNRSSTGRLWNWSMYGYRIGSYLIYPLIFAVIYIPLLAIFDISSDSSFIWIASTLAISAVGGWCFGRYVGRDLWDKWCYRMAVQCYRGLWRREVMQIMSRTFIPYYDLMNRIYNTQHPEEVPTCQSWLIAFAGNDPALEIYSGAQQFVT